MKLDRRTFLTGTAVTFTVPGTIDFASAQEKVIRFALARDLRRVYMFVTAEYSQGQRDYITLVNERGGINGYRIIADVSDHGNDLPRAIEAYEKAKREGAVLIDPLSTPVARALVPRALEDKINMVTAFSGRSRVAESRCRSCRYSRKNLASSSRHFPTPLRATTSLRSGRRSGALARTG